MVEPLFYRPPFAAILPAGNQVYCEGSALAVSAATSAPGDTTIMGYRWLRMVGGVATPVAGMTTNPDTLLREGDFEVVVFDHNGCSDTSAVVRILKTTPPVAALSAPFVTTACAGDSIRLSAGGSQYADAFEWLRDGVSVHKSTSNGDSILYATESGQYQVVASNAGCADTSAVTVSISITPRPDLTVLSPVTYACNVPSITLDAGNPGATYVWNTGATSQTLLVTAPGFYAVKITTPGGCADSVRTEVRFLNAPGVAAQSLGAYCAEETIALSAAATGGETSYRWTTNGAGELQNADQLLASY